MSLYIPADSYEGAYRKINGSYEQALREQGVTSQWIIQLLQQERKRGCTEQSDGKKLWSQLHVPPGSVRHGLAVGGRTAGVSAGMSFVLSPWYLLTATLSYLLCDCTVSTLEALEMNAELTEKLVRHFATMGRNRMMRLHRRAREIRKRVDRLVKDNGNIERKYRGPGLCAYLSSFIWNPAEGDRQWNENTDEIEQLLRVHRRLQTAHAVYSDRIQAGMRSPQNWTLYGHQFRVFYRESDKQPRVEAA